MKILTATSRTQGHRPSDFNWCVEGELVTTSTVICERDKREGPDGGCGCGRAWAGLNSHKATTTAMVRELDGFTYEDLAIAVRSYREQSGWLAVTDEPDKAVADEVAHLAEIAASHVTGTVLEVRMDEITERTT